MKIADQQPEALKPRQEMDNTKGTEAPQYQLQDFELTRILQNNAVRKSCALLGKFPSLSVANNAIVLFEKTAFDESDVQTANAAEGNDGAETKLGDKAKRSYFNGDLTVHTEFINNIYGSFMCVPAPELNSIKTTVIYPATDKHIEKYSICRKFLLNETPGLYENVTLPYIKKSQFSLEWVYNILEHKQETDRIIYEDTDDETGFVLLPDLKWDGKNVDTLYVLAIVRKRNVMSLRDLRGDHLRLLRNIYTSAGAAIEKQYGLPQSQLRMYFHYQPSFYHLHVHINPLRNDAPGIWCEKSHMLNTVINNLEICSDYYNRATLPFVLYEGSSLLELYGIGSPKRKRMKFDAVVEQPIEAVQSLETAENNEHAKLEAK